VKVEQYKKRPIFYSFSTFIIKIVIVLKLETSVSFRGISKVLSILSEYTDINLETPEHTTIISYVKKLGIYNLKKPKEKANDWIIILDESIEFGNEKILVVLGIREKDIDFTRAFKYQDLVPLTIKISNSWKGEEIKNEIELLKEEIGEIKYAIADNGNAIKKSLRLAEISHVEDITHKFSWFIKQIYKENVQFKSYTKKLAHLRGSMPLSKLAYILPPAQRTHSRFMNLKPIVDWGNSIVRLFESEKELKPEREKLGFVSGYKSFLNEIDLIISIAIKIQRIVKNKGLSKKTVNQCKLLLKQKGNNKNINTFKVLVLNYLSKILSIGIEKKSSKLVCTSDIIESCFGKYKSFINANPSIGITDLCLTISAITCDYKQEDEILNAMESVKTVDVIKWKDKNIGKTLLSRRKKVIKKEGGAKKSKIIDF